MASVKKGDGKEEIMEPRSTSVWEVWKNFSTIFQFKEYDTLIYQKNCCNDSNMLFTTVSKSSSNDRCQGGRVILIVPTCPQGRGEEI